MREPPPVLFDRALIAHRLRTRGRPDAGFLLARAAEDLIERLGVTTRRFAHALDIATPTDAAAAALAASGKVGSIRRADFDADERLEAAPESADLAVSLLALQFANDPPGALIQARRALKPGGLFLAAMIGGDTLTELRQALLAAESALLGGASPRIIPFADVKSLGALLQRANFRLPVADVDRVTARYPDVFALMRDLRAMGAANPLIARSRKPLRRDVLMAAAEAYAARHAGADGKLPATFDILWLSGWAPDAATPAPAGPIGLSRGIL